VEQGRRFPDTAADLDPPSLLTRLCARRASARSGTRACSPPRARCGLIIPKPRSLLTRCPRRPTERSIRRVRLRHRQGCELRPLARGHGHAPKSLL